MDVDVELRSFERDMTAVVIGAGGGIGRAFVEALSQAPRVSRVFATGRAALPAETEKISALRLDLEDETSIEAAAVQVREQAGRVSLVIVATGLLHDGARVMPEKSWRALDPAAMERVFRINTIGPSLVGKHFLPLLPRQGKAVFAALSARVGSISDNRLGGWHAYRASKAALNMVLRNFAIELARKAPDAAVIGLHPGTVETGLSAPFRSNVPSEQLFDPARSAGHLLDVIDGVTAEDSGSVFAWDGARIPE